MKEVTAYLDLDGKLHENAKACKAADKTIALRNRLNDLLDQYGWNTMTKQDVVDLLMEHAGDLTEVLK